MGKNTSILLSALPDFEEPGETSRQKLMLGIEITPSVTAAPRLFPGVNV